MATVQPPTKQPSQVDRLLELGERAALFHTPNGDAYADIPVMGGRETCPVKSRTFRQWLLVEYDDQYGGAPSNNAMQEALNTLEARACVKGQEQEVYLRLGTHDEAIYLDMCDKARRVIEVTGDGWRLIPAEKAPIRFRRTPEMSARPLPDPKQGGSIDRLFDVLNIPNDDSRVLVKGFLLGLLHPTGPYPGLALYGEQGTAKTSTARYLRSVVDPTSAPVTGDPRDIETAALQAHANWVPVLDNVRTVRDWLADFLCRLATGGAFNKRTHYEMTDLTVVNTKRPFMLTSIADAIQQPDLINRVLTIRLPVIPKNERKSEDWANAKFAEVHSEVLGGLLDAAVMALRGYKSVQLDELPRMADLAKWVTAAEPAMCLKPGTFIRAYAGNETDAYEAAINANPVARAVIRLMEAQALWKGTPTSLYNDLSALVDNGYGRKPTGWPTSPQLMANKLNEAAPALRTRGIDVRRVRLGDDRGWCLERLESPSESGEEEETYAPDAEEPLFSFRGQREEEKEKQGLGAYVASGMYAADAYEVDDQDEEDYSELFA